MVLGQSVTLACQVSAQPAAQATWDKGKELSWCQEEVEAWQDSRGYFLISWSSTYRGKLRLR